MKLDGVEFDGFADGATAKQLYDERYSTVPARSGVYIVLRDSTAPPAFLRTSNAGRFKDRDPSYPFSEVELRWVQGDALFISERLAGHAGSGSASAN